MWPCVRSLIPATLFRPLSPKHAFEERLRGVYHPAPTKLEKSVRVVRTCVWRSSSGGLRSSAKAAQTTVPTSMDTVG